MPPPVCVDSPQVWIMEQVSCQHLGNLGTPRQAEPQTDTAPTHNMMSLAAI